MIRPILTILLAAAIIGPLSGCARKAKPIPPEDSVYPRQYPQVYMPGSGSQPVKDDDSDEETEPNTAKPTPTPPPFYDLRHDKTSRP